MGRSIDRTTFTDDDRVRFRERLHESLDVLETLLATPGFGRGETSIGAELELCIVDARGRAAPIADALREGLGDDRLTLEINRYDIEANLTPGPMAGQPFRRLENEMIEMLALLNEGASGHDAQVVPVGILPTLRPRDLKADMITPDARYETLTHELRKRRGEKFHIRMRGRESLSAKTDSVAPEGACTSLQIHYRAHPERFVDLFNAVQLTTPLLVGFAANSPYLLGRELWHETRIGLFRQSIDGRDRHRRALSLPARVHIGHGWLRRSALEAFAETVRLYEPLLPIVEQGQGPRETLKAGEQLPALDELALQMGTVWPWNRVIYEPSDGGHVRVELRALPAGPSAVDMAANAALAIGLAEGLLDDIEALVTAMPHALLVQNLESAARHGMQARLLWPAAGTHRLEERALVDILGELLPRASSGLAAAGVDTEEAQRCLANVERRLAARASGAGWQLDAVARLQGSAGKTRKRALRTMFQRYTERSLANRPIADWTHD